MTARQKATQTALVSQEAVQQALAALLAPALTQVAPLAVESSTDKPERPQAAEQQPKLAYTVTSFCKAHEISTPTFYRLQKVGKGPVLMQIGSEVRISFEAAADWRRAREADHRAKGEGA